MSLISTTDTLITVCKNCGHKSDVADTGLGLMPNCKNCGKSDYTDKWIPQPKVVDCNGRHDWVYTGQNERQVASGDKWPNRYYKCSKCGETKIDREWT